jgi:predicted RNase H-like nuclease
MPFPDELAHPVEISAYDVRSVGLEPPAYVRGQGYAADDLLDACVVAWTAARYAAGTAYSLPDPPEVFSDGIPAAIWV